jgi:hypothetical protein
VVKVASLAWPKINVRITSVIAFFSFLILSVAARVLDFFI